MQPTGRSFFTTSKNLSQFYTTVTRMWKRPFIKMNILFWISKRKKRFGNTRKLAKVLITSYYNGGHFAGRLFKMKSVLSRLRFLRNNAMPGGNVWHDDVKNIIKRPGARFSKSKNNCKVSCLETPSFWRYKENYVTRNTPEKFRDFRETGPRIDSQEILHFFCAILMWYYTTGYQSS